MRMISSLVRVGRFDAVKQALSKINVVALSVVEARDYTPQSHGTTAWMGHLHVHDSSLKVEVQIVVDDDDVDEVVGIVMRAARTGTTGDGHICVLPVEHRYSIATGLREV
jgi:nitrogen regulatory protein P-II 1